MAQRAKHKDSSTAARGAAAPASDNVRFKSPAEKQEDLRRIRLLQQEKAALLSAAAEKKRKEKEDQERLRKNLVAKKRQDNENDADRLGGGDKKKKTTSTTSTSTSSSSSSAARGGYNPMNPWSGSTGGGYKYVIIFLDSIRFSCWKDGEASMHSTTEFIFISSCVFLNDSFFFNLFETNRAQRRSTQRG
jgi:hypothetical protein